jgi:predicted MPP superfamily phosphohydrolase
MAVAADTAMRLILGDNNDDNKSPTSSSSTTSTPAKVTTTATVTAATSSLVDRFRFARDRTYTGLESYTPSSSSATSTISLGRASYYFACLADPQLGFDKDNRSWDEEAERSRIAVAALNRLQPRPKFAIVCGDLTHALPGEPAYIKQAADYKAIYAEVHPDIPLLCLCGNHDVGNRPTASSIGSYVSRFGDDYYSFVLRDVSTFGIVVNSSLWRDPGLAPHLQVAQLEWFKRELIRATTPSLWSPEPPRHIMVFAHHPWFLERADEPDQYFNIPLVLRTEALSLMKQYGVQAAFSGHYHRNAGGFTKDGMEMIVTSAVGKPLGVDPCGFRLVKVLNDDIDDDSKTTTLTTSSTTTESKTDTSSLPTIVRSLPRRLDHRYFHLDEMPTNITLTRDSWGSVSDSDEPERERQRRAALAIDNATVKMPPLPPGMWPPPSVDDAPPPTLGKRVLVQLK